MNAMMRDPDNRLGKLLASGKPDAAILEELYLSAVLPPPAEAEAKKILAVVAAAKDRRAGKMCSGRW